MPFRRDRSGRALPGLSRRTRSTIACEWMRKTSPRRPLAETDGYDGEDSRSTPSPSRDNAPARNHPGRAALAAASGPRRFRTLRRDPRLPQRPGHRDRAHGHLGLVMDCDTTGIERISRWLKFKKLGRRRLFQDHQQVRFRGAGEMGSAFPRSSNRGHARGSRHHGHNARGNQFILLRKKAFRRCESEKVEAVLPSPSIIASSSTSELGEDFCRRLGSRQKTLDPGLDLLASPVTRRDIERGQDHVCGTMTSRARRICARRHLQRSSNAPWLRQDRQAASSA